MKAFIVLQLSSFGIIINDIDMCQKFKILKCNLFLIALLFTTSHLFAQGLLPVNESDLSVVEVWEPSEDTEQQRLLLAQGFALEAEIVDKTVPVFSIGQYCPAIADQSIYNNCVGWSVAYYAMSTRLNYLMGVKDDNLKFIFSLDPNHLLVSRSNNKELWESSGANFKDEFEYVKKYGAPFRINFSGVIDGKNKSVKTVKIKSWNRLDLKTDGLETMKSALFSGKPIVFGIAISDDVFKRNFKFEKAVFVPSDIEGKENFQALTIVGFNDLIDGGVFEVVTSYGKQFGNAGRCYIRYEDFLNIVHEAYVFDLDFPNFLKGGLENVNLGSSVYESTNSGIEFRVLKNADNSFYVGGYKDGKRTGIGAEVMNDEIRLYSNFPDEYQGQLKSKNEGFDEFYELISLLIN